ncbi:hypothetical protein EV426DRAFT_601257 [Tirmania nivea]|nr:hypothetical protein EV426DRAFT_601257 [Tirmania nivea]
MIMLQRRLKRRRALLLASVSNSADYPRYRYRPPLAYEQATWTLLWGDIECREYLRFTRAELAQLLVCLTKSHLLV